MADPGATRSDDQIAREMENQFLGNRCRRCMGSGAEPPNTDEEYQKRYPYLEMPPRCQKCKGMGRICETCLGDGHVLRPNGDIDWCSDCEGSGEHEHVSTAWMDRL